MSDEEATKVEQEEQGTGKMYGESAKVAIGMVIVILMLAGLVGFMFIFGWLK